MTTLTNFPMVSQLSTVTGDGRPSENAAFDCVAASIDAACRWLLGTPENSIFNPDHFKDEAYGEALRNSGTSASDYVAFCKTLGIHLYAVETPDYAHAIQVAHQYIRENKPVIFTRDDPYVDQRVHPDWTHVCVFFSEDGSGLTALDPYIAKPVYKTDAAWVDILRSSELWLTERIEDVVTIDLTMPIISGYFTLVNGNQWQRKNAPNGKVIILHGDMLKNYQTCGTKPYCGLSQAGLPESNEIPIEQFGAEFAHLAGSGIVVVYFERQPWIYDPKHLIDNPPGAGTVYPLHLYQLPGQDPLVTKLQAQVIAQQATITAQEAQIAQLQTQQTSEPNPIAAIHQAQAIFAPFK